MSNWTLKSTPPHDWFLCLDIDQYFDHEHDPELIFEEGFSRPIPLGDRDILVTTFFNGDPDDPEFHFESPESLSKEEITQANNILARILGANIDLRPLYDQAADDPVWGHYSPNTMDLNGCPAPTFLRIPLTGLLKCAFHTNLRPKKWYIKCVRIMDPELQRMEKAYRLGRNHIN